MLTLTCRVTVVEGLTVQPDVEWLDSGGGAVMSGVNNITVGNVMRNGSLGLEFSPLHTSHGGQYTCRATINIPSIDVTGLNGSSSQNVTVRSKHCSEFDGCILNNGFSSAVLPPSSVVISASQSGSLSAGTPLTLTCTTTLSKFVDDGEEVNTVWTGPALSSGSRINITNTEDSTPPHYASELTISPLDARMDSGEYNCSVTVKSHSGRKNVTSTPVIEGQMVSVTGEAVYLPGVFKLRIFLLLYTALKAPVVIIETAGTPTAEEMLTLTCRVTVVGGLTVQPDVEWVDSGGSAVMSSVSNVTVGGLMRNGNEFTLDLEFSPLHTSHGGQYTCSAIINIESIGVSGLNGSTSQAVIVERMLLNALFSVI